MNPKQLKRLIRAYHPDAVISKRKRDGELIGFTAVDEEWTYHVTGNCVDVLRDGRLVTHRCINDESEFIALYDGTIRRKVGS